MSCRVTRPPERVYVAAAIRKFRKHISVIAAMWRPRLHRRRLPLGAPGVRHAGHLGIQYGLPNNVVDNVRRFDKLGLESAFTEVDVRMPLPADPVKLAAQTQGFTTLLQGLSAWWSTAGWPGVASPERGRCT